MRQTYKNRRDFCVHLFRPLGMLGFVHQSRGEIDKAVEVTREAFRKSLTSPLCYIIGPDVNLRLAQLHSVLGNKASAKKVE
jgi:hypothetical protein